MIVIVAIDDKAGMMFNKRRQSQDKVLRDKVLQLTQGSVLWMNAYTAKQFDGITEGIQIDEMFLQKASKGEFCFVENEKLESVACQIEKMVIFKWNRRYPGDFFLDVTPDKCGLVCTHTEEFEGSSHEKITMEIWG